MNVLPALVVAAIPAYFLWWLLRDYFVSSSLDNIPGPPSPSTFSGKLHTLIRRMPVFQSNIDC